MQKLLYYVAVVTLGFLALACDPFLEARFNLTRILIVQVFVAWSLCQSLKLIFVKAKSEALEKACKNVLLWIRFAKTLQGLCFCTLFTFSCQKNRWVLAALVLSEFGQLTMYWLVIRALSPQVVKSNCAEQNQWMVTAQIEIYLRAHRLQSAWHMGIIFCIGFLAACDYDVLQPIQCTQQGFFQFNTFGSSYLGNFVKYYGFWYYMFAV